MTGRTTLQRRVFVIRVITVSLILSTGCIGGGCSGNSGTQQQVGPDGERQKAPLPDGVKNMQEYMKEQMAKKRGGKAKQKVRAPSR